MNYRRISPENIPSLHFPKFDVITTPADKEERVHGLRSATALTTSDHEEVGLVVQLDTGEIVEVISNMIDYEGDFVEIKGGYIIPLKAIMRVEI